MTSEEVGILKRLLAEKQTQLKAIKANGKGGQERRESAGNKAHYLARLERSLDAAIEATNSVDGFTLICHCDTNFFYHTEQDKGFVCTWKVGDSPVQQQLVDSIEHSEYLGIRVVLNQLKTMGVQGRILIITDASRCVHALQQAMGFIVKPHSENQSPRNCDYGELFKESLAILKELQAQGCVVEFRYKHRSYINEALGITKPSRSTKEKKEARKERRRNETAEKSGEIHPQDDCMGTIDQPRVADDVPR